MTTESLSYYLNENPQYYKDKHVIITGATGGIGSLLTSSLLSLGCKIVAIVRDEAKLKSMFGKNIEDGTLQYQIMDFLLETEYFTKFSDIMIKLGGKIDILFLCHGEYFQAEYMDIDIKDYDRLTNINTRPIMLLISLATPFLKYTKGNVVVISSLESYIPTKNSFLNTTTKCMVNMIIQNSALELASFGIRVNGIAPGITETNFRIKEFEEPKEKNNEIYNKEKGFENLMDQTIIKPEDIVDTLLFLGSPDAGFITGEIIKIDNGYCLNHNKSFNIWDSNKVVNIGK
jgi:NAD(P)-dependent dehydrogenase (short-subunit alcohol dehydrogenase family)